MILILALCIMSVTARFPGPPIFTAVKHPPAICYLPPDSGLCSNKSDDNNLDLLIRYYFDTETNQCYQFGVQGCGGNENRFPDREECERICVIDRSS